MPKILDSIIGITPQNNQPTGILNTAQFVPRVFSQINPWVNECGSILGYTIYIYIIYHIHMYVYIYSYSELDADIYFSMCMLSGRSRRRCCASRPRFEIYVGEDLIWSTMARQRSPNLQAEGASWVTLNSYGPTVTVLSGMK